MLTIGLAYAQESGEEVPRSQLVWSSVQIYNKINTELIYYASRNIRKYMKRYETWWWDGRCSQGSSPDAIPDPSIFNIKRKFSLKSVLITHRSRTSTTSKTTRTPFSSAQVLTHLMNRTASHALVLTPSSHPASLGVISHLTPKQVLVKFLLVKVKFYVDQLSYSQ